MTTPDPSRVAFERHMRSLNPCTQLQRQSEQCGGAYRTVSVERNWKLWQAAMAHCVSSIPADAIAVNLVRHVGLDKHVARECEQIVRTLVGAKLWLPEVIDAAKAEAREFDDWFDAAPKQEGGT